MCVSTEDGVGASSNKEARVQSGYELIEIWKQ